MTLRFFRHLCLPALAAACLSLVACGSSWTSVPVGSMEENTQQLGEYARFTLEDERVIEMRVLNVEFPFVDGHRVLGRWSTPRVLRLDLRRVSKVEVRGSAS